MEKNDIRNYIRKNFLTKKKSGRNKPKYSHSPRRKSSFLKKKESRKIHFANINNSKNRFMARNSNRRSHRVFKDMLSKIDNNLQIASFDLKTSISAKIGKKLITEGSSNRVRNRKSPPEVLKIITKRNKKKNKNRRKAFDIFPKSIKDEESFQLRKSIFNTPRVRTLRESSKEKKMIFVEKREIKSLENKKYLYQEPNELILHVTKNNLKIKKIKKRIQEVEKEYNLLKDANYPLLRLSVRNAKKVLRQEKMNLIDNKPQGIVDRISSRNKYLSENQNLFDLNSKMKKRLKIKLNIYDKLKGKYQTLKSILSGDGILKQKELFYENFLKVEYYKKKIKEEEKLIKEEKKNKEFEVRFLNKNINRASKKNDYLLSLRKQTKIYLDKSKRELSNKKNNHVRITNTIYEIEAFLNKYNTNRSYRSSLKHQTDLKKMGIDSFLMRTEENDITSSERFESRSRDGKERSPKPERDTYFKKSTLLVPKSRYEDMNTKKAKYPVVVSQGIDNKTPRFPSVELGKITRRQNQFGRKQTESEYFSPSFSPSIDEEKKDSEKRKKSGKMQKSEKKNNFEDEKKPMIMISKVEHKMAPVAFRDFSLKKARLGDGKKYHDNHESHYIPEPINKNSDEKLKLLKNSTSIKKVTSKELVSPLLRKSKRFKTEKIGKTSISSLRDEEIMEQNLYAGKILENIKKRREKKLKTVDVNSTTKHKKKEKFNFHKEKHRNSKRHNTDFTINSGVKEDSNKEVEEKFKNIIKEIDDKKNIDLKSYYGNSRISRNSIDMSQLRSSRHENSLPSERPSMELNPQETDQHKKLLERKKTKWDRVKMSISDISKVEARDDPLNPQKIVEDTSQIIHKEKNIIPEKDGWSRFKEEDMLVGNESKKESYSGEYSSFIRTSTKKSSVVTENNFIDFSALN